MTTTIRRARAALAITVAALVLVAAACGSQSSPEPATESTSGLQPIDRHTLQTLVDDTIARLRVPGAVVLLRTPQGEITVGSGTTELGVQRRPDAATHFRIASNTKTMTAAVILQLADEGKLGLGDPVSKYVANVPGGDEIDIAELLQMRSGLYNYTDSPVIAASLDDDPTKAWTPQELLDVAFAHPPRFAPGARFEYCNTNYVLLGIVVEKVDGRSLAAAMKARLFDPLGMRNTMLPEATSSRIPEPYAHGYLYGSSSVALAGTPDYTPEEIARAEAGTLRPTDYTDVNHSFAGAAGGVTSTAGDLAIWMQALVGGQMLDRRYQQLWLGAIQPEDPAKPAGMWYGYGISQLRWGSNALRFHGGETAGYNSFMGVDLGNEMTLIVWTNLTVDVATMQPTANTLMLKILDRIYVQSPLAPRPASTSPVGGGATAPSW